MNTFWVLGDFPDSKLCWVNIGQCLANAYTIGPMGLAMWVITVTPRPIATWSCHDYLKK